MKYFGKAETVGFENDTTIVVEYAFGIRTAVRKSYIQFSGKYYFYRCFKKTYAHFAKLFLG